MSLNRRDYLKQLAFTAGALAASRFEVFGQKVHRKILPHEIIANQDAEIETVDIAENFKSWPVGTHPAAPSITVFFVGLLDFYYNANGPDEKSCGIGFVDSGMHHMPHVELKENGGLPIAIAIPPNAEVRLGTIDAQEQWLPANALFLIDRGKPYDDFRWLIDMQAKSWYEGVPTKGPYAAKLFVRNGTFFTKKRTRYNLDQVMKVETLGLAYLRTAALTQPAEIIGCEINTGGNDALLKVNNQTWKLTNGKSYEISFINKCDGSDPACCFLWSDFKEAKRNDFHHHRKALDLKAYHLRYSVVLAPPLLKRRTQCIFNSDEAPCMGAGYGGGPGPA